MAAMLGMALLAGCLGSAATEPLAPEGITAKEAEARGMAHATDWNGDARLLSLIGLESRQRIEEEVRGMGQFDDTTLVIPGDGNVGDGRAPAWLLAFMSVEAKCLLFLVLSSEGGSEHDWCFPPEMPDIPADAVPNLAGTWSVDTPQVAEIVRAQEGVDEILAAEDAMMAFSIEVEDDEDEPLEWEVEVSSASLARSAEVEVDANTGEVLEVELRDSAAPFRGDAELPGHDLAPLEFAYNGEVSASQPEATHPFEVPPGYEDLEVHHFTTDGTIPGDDATLRILGPDGEELEPDGDTYELDQAGTYTAVVAFDPAVTPVPGLPGVQYDLRFMVR